MKATRKMVEEVSETLWCPPLLKYMLLCSFTVDITGAP